MSETATFAAGCFWGEDVCTDRTGHENHDPTTLNRQGPYVGAQYRSAIFYHNETQHAAAAVAFYPGEEYHQRYLEKRGLSSCHVSLTQ